MDESVLVRRYINTWGSEALSLKNDLLFFRARLRISHIMIGVGLFLLIFLWWWYRGVYCVLVQNERRCLTSIQVLEQQKKRLPELTYQVQQLQEQHDALRTQLQQHQHTYAQLDPYVRLEQLFTDVMRSNLRLIAFSPQASSKKDFYERALFTIKVAGSFDQIMAFLKMFKQRIQYAKFKDAFIEHCGTNLSFQATIALYRIDPEGVST